jgi:uncharacterized repeat protein (TIGR01451 family)
MELGPGDLRKREGQVLLEAVKGPQQHHQQEQLAGVIGRQRPSQTEALMTTSVVANVEGTRAVKGELRLHDFSAICREEPRTTDSTLKLEKWCDKTDAEIGDVVSFTLKYSNLGGRSLTDIIVSDSLTTRLEYVPGSAQSSRNAVFTSQPNEAGSLILRWQINGALLPGQSGVVRFQARVR